MFIADSYPGKTCLRGCVTAPLCLLPGRSWQIPHEKVGVKPQQGIGNIRATLRDERGDLVYLLPIDISWDQQGAGYKKGNPWPFVNIPGDPLEIIQGPFIAYPAQGTVEILGPCLEIELNAAPGF